MNLEEYFLNGGYERSISERKKLEKNKKVLRTKVSDYYVDSCWTFDAGYETAIWYRDNRMVIVERYDSEEKMKKGHKKWVKFCKDEPTTVYSVQYNTVENLKGDV